MAAQRLQQEMKKIEESVEEGSTGHRSEVEAQQPAKNVTEGDSFLMRVPLIGSPR